MSPFLCDLDVWILPEPKGLQGFRRRSRGVTTAHIYGRATLPQPLCRRFTRSISFNPQGNCKNQILVLSPFQWPRIAWLGRSELDLQQIQKVTFWTAAVKTSMYEFWGNTVQPVFHNCDQGHGWTPKSGCTLRRKNWHIIELKPIKCLMSRMEGNLVIRTARCPLNPGERES